MMEAVVASELGMERSSQPLALTDGDDTRTGGTCDRG